MELFDLQILLILKLLLIYEYGKASEILILRVDLNQLSNCLYHVILQSIIFTNFKEIETWYVSSAINI